MHKLDKPDDDSSSTKPDDTSSKPDDKPTTLPGNLNGDGLVDIEDAFVDNQPH